MEALTNYYNTIINEVATKAVEAFNNSYNLNINKDDIMANLVNELNTAPSVNEMAGIFINDKCMCMKRNKTPCSNKFILIHVYCGIHLHTEEKKPLNEHIKIVSTKYKYEVTANTISLGNDYYMAIHYVEINKYNEEFQSYSYAIMSLKSIASLNDKPIFNKIKSFFC
ncbi:hypothetical protein PIROE2DRAFT_15775 [Piromyces sp. E2]|nr:hypothetical protein PIROE2DRAFT_15775 [Piromyces sp. E2]|eukprot:OUM58873.1 hypothetical protein PIROE2DRAFT_15775 [Piromyces sp. E2]